MFEDSPREELVEKYFEEIEHHVLAQIRDGKVGDSCFAAVMLIFAGIDGLGRLLHPDDNVAADSPGERFKWALRFLGRGYEDRAAHLWNLRNSLMHNALNVAAYLWAAEHHEMPFEHLEVTESPQGLRIYVNTSKLGEDFATGLANARKTVSKDSEVLKKAANRLEEVTVGHDDEKYDFTVASPVRFVMLR